MEANPYPHPIRLRGPWECKIIRCDRTPSDIIATEASPDAPQNTTIDFSTDWRRTTVPGDWSALFATPQQAAEFRGLVRYRRSFGQPATLAPNERAWLVIEGVDARGSATLNGTRLGDIAGYAVHASFDVTDLLAQRNELILDVELPDDADTISVPRPGREHLPGGPIGDVRLEIRSHLWLENIAIQLLHPPGGSTTVRATGRVAGSESINAPRESTNAGDRAATDQAAELNVELFVSEPVTAGGGLPRRNSARVAVRAGQEFSIDCAAQFLPANPTPSHQASAIEVGASQINSEVLLRLTSDQVLWGKWLQVRS